MVNSCNFNGINIHDRGNCLDKCMHKNVGKCNLDTTIFCATCAVLFGFDKSNDARVCRLCTGKTKMLLYDAQQECNEVNWKGNEYKFNPLTLEEAIIPQQSYHVKNAQLILNEVILKREGKSITQIDKKVNKMMNSIFKNAFLGEQCAKV